MSGLRWKVELYNPKVKHVEVVRLDATTAELASRMARTHLVMRRRRSSLPGLATDYRVEHVDLITRKRP